MRYIYVKEFQDEWRRLYGEELTRGTAQEYMRSIAEFFKTLDQIDQQIKAEDAEKESTMGAASVRPFCSMIDRHFLSL